jgi:hypothetical protein
MNNEYGEQKVNTYFWTILSGLTSYSGAGEHWKDPQVDIRELVKDIELRDNVHSAVLYQYVLKPDFTIRPEEVRRVDLKEGSGVLWEMKNKL